MKKDDFDSLPDYLKEAIGKPGDTPPAETPSHADACTSPPATAAPGTAAGPMTDFERATRYVRKVPGTSEGARNTALNVLAYRLAELFNLSESEHHDLCATWAASCTPPLPDAETKATIRSAWNGAKQKGTLGSKRTETKVKGQARGKSEKRGHKRTSRPGETDLASAFLRERNLKQPPDVRLRCYGRQWFFFTGTHYKNIPADDLHAQVSGFLADRGAALGRRYSLTLANNVVSVLKSSAFGHVPSDVPAPLWLDAPPREARNAVVLANGVFDVDAWLKGPSDFLCEHSARFFSTAAALPFKYDPQAQAPRFEQYLSLVQPDAEVRRHMLEFAGLCLIYETKFNKMLLLHGQPGTGKSTFLTVLELLIGEDYCSSVNLEAFTGNNTFMLFDSKGKKVNVLHETGEVDRMAEDILKTVIGGVRFQFNAKYRDPVTDRATARWVVATNHRPRFHPTGGMADRVLLVPFGVRVRGTEIDNPAVAQPDFWKSNPDELSGAFNLFLQGLKRLTERGKFLEPPACQQAAAHFWRTLDTTRTWIEENLLYEREANTPRKKIFNRYRNALKNDGNMPLSRASFEDRVLNIMEARRLELQEEQRKAGTLQDDLPPVANTGDGKATTAEGNRDRCWKNLTLVSNQETFEEEA